MNRLSMSAPPDSSRAAKATEIRNKSLTHGPRAGPVSSNRSQALTEGFILSEHHTPEVSGSAKPTAAPVDHYLGIADSGSGNIRRVRCAKPFPPSHPLATASTASLWSFMTTRGPVAISLLHHLTGRYQGMRCWSRPPLKPNG